MMLAALEALSCRRLPPTKEGGLSMSGVRGNKAGRPARITPRVLQRVSSPRRQRRSLATALESQTVGNRNGSLALPRPARPPPRHRAAADAGEDRKRVARRATGRKEPARNASRVGAQPTRA